jgi:hypothetical protein
LIYEVIPMLKTLEHRLTAIRDSSEAPNVIRIASQAALMVIGKYYALTDNNEVYCIAMGEFSLKYIKIRCLTFKYVAVMCPNRKLVWFENNLDWRADDVTEVGRVVQARWVESYATSETQESELPATLPVAEVKAAKVSKT